MPRKPQGTLSQSPRPLYQTLNQMDRNRSMRLGLPVFRPKPYSMKVPWGYEINPEDETELLPIEDDIQLLRRAKDYLDTGNYSIKEVARWLSSNSHSGYVSNKGLQKILEYRPPFVEVKTMTPEERMELQWMNHDQSRRKEKEEELASKPKRQKSLRIITT